MGVKKPRRIIEETLIPLIDNDYIFIDLPYYSNIGDALIWKGTESLLSAIPHKCLCQASCKTFQHINLQKSTVIIMMGGGNWGDLYPIHNEFRRRIVRDYPNNKIIILPQTVYYEGARNARHDAEIFRQHKKLIIFARDRYSYRFLKLFRFGNDIRLMPDMAFCIDTDLLRQMAVSETGKTLLFNRIDKEKVNIGEEVTTLTENNSDMADWPLYGMPDSMLNHLNVLIGEGKFTEANQYAIKTYLPSRVRTGIEFISQYRRVISNRLHGAILSILLGKETYILDNSYGKNFQYYDTWLRNAEGVKLLSKSKRFDLRRKMRFLYHLLFGGFSK